MAIERQDIARVIGFGEPEVGERWAWSSRVRFLLASDAQGYEYAAEASSPTADPATTTAGKGAALTVR